MDINDVGPRDPRWDGVLGVGAPAGFDLAKWNKFHGKLSSLILAITIWIVSSIIAGAIIVVALGLLLQLISILEHRTAFNLLAYYRSSDTGYAASIMFMMFVNAIMFKIPFIVYLGWRTQRSLWTAIKFAHWGYIVSVFQSGGSEEAAGRINRINMFGC